MTYSNKSDISQIKINNFRKNQFLGKTGKPGIILFRPAGKTGAAHDMLLSSCRYLTDTLLACYINQGGERWRNWNISIGWRNRGMLR